MGESSDGDAAALRLPQVTGCDEQATAPPTFRRPAVDRFGDGFVRLPPPEDVTVADIAAAADMTAAAVYYHFPSKEHVLLEG